jgi:acetoacetyl-CoA synthetase
MPGAQFFPNARLNFAENQLKHTGSGDAVVFRGRTRLSAG